MLYHVHKVAKILCNLPITLFILTIAVPDNLEAVFELGLPVDGLVAVEAGRVHDDPVPGAQRLAAAGGAASYNNF